MHPTATPTLLPRMSPLTRLILSGALLAGLFYLLLFWTPAPEPERTDVAAPPIVVAVPILDTALLATAKDGSRDERLVLEAEPLQHLLGKSIDVGPTVAAALGMPADPVPLAELQEAPERWRGRWLWFEGEVVELTGPRTGHPIRGRSIYEATLRLRDGNHAMATFTEPPPATVTRGGWARIEGYLLKLRDTTYPISTERAPLLVGRAIQQDYPDWGPVTQLDRQVLPEIASQDYFPGSQAWQDLENDQCEALWHLAAFARDTAPGQSLAHWRQFGVLNLADTYPLLQRNLLAPGTPLRVLGTLVRRTTLAAPANPANIRHWTTAWVQVRDFGGHVIPVWVPRRAEELPTRTDVEIRGYFYRWFVYEAMDGKRYTMPLFVAADLDAFDLGVAETTVWISSMTAGGILLLAIGILWTKRRWAKATLQHERELDERRKRRRERRTGAAPAEPASSTP